jgi:hypothetical protein
VTDKEDAKKLKTEIYQRLATKGKIEPYFPLTRNGDYRLSYDGKGDGNLDTSSNTLRLRLSVSVPSKSWRMKAASRMCSGSRAASKRTYKDAPSTSFVNSILRTLEANKVDPEVTDEIMRTFLSTLPESSFAQAFRKLVRTPPASASTQRARSTHAP